MYKESQWTPEAELLEEMDFSDSGKESEEHRSSDDVNYYSESNSEDEEEGDDIDD